MTAVPHILTAEQLAAVGVAAADHRARAEELRWAARRQDMEAVLDDLAVALLPHPDITHLVGTTCGGIDCRFDKGLTLTDYNCFPHLHFDVVVTAREGSLVLGDRSAVPAGIRVADLEEDHEGIHPDSCGWQVSAPYRTAPPAGFDAAEDEVWLDAAALRTRVSHLLAPLIDGPVSDGRLADARTAALDAQLDKFAASLHKTTLSWELWAIGFQRCDEQDCFAPEETSYPHLHPETVLACDEDGTVDTRQYILSEMPDYLLADDSGWSIPDLYRTIPIDADGPWDDPDIDFWVDAAALCARAADVR